MRKIQKIVYPYVPETLFYGDIVSWKFRNKITPVKGKYCYRALILFSDGSEHLYQKGGFKSEAEAIKAKEMAILALNKRTFIPYEYTVKEYYEFWLYYCLLKNNEITYNTYYSYRNIIYNYIIPYFDSKNINDITIEDLQYFLRKIDSDSIFTLCCTVLKSSFSYASAHRIIASNPSPLSVKLSKKERSTKKQVSISNKELSIRTPHDIGRLLLNCKDIASDFYPMLLIAITTGLRKSETLALKYSDIDLTNKCLIVSKQLGKSISGEDGSITDGDQKLKTIRSDRVVPLADFVIDELILARKRYEINKNTIPCFQDTNLICCKTDGTPFTKKYPGDILNLLVKECKFEHIRWHDLRHIYATVLADNNINMKAISEFLGHAKSDFTKKVYVEPEPGAKIINPVKYIKSYIDDLLYGDYDTTLQGISNSYIQKLFSSDK